MTRQAAFDTITGKYIGPGVTCPQFRLDSGETISLSGAHPVLQPGERLTLTGRWAMNSKCMQGREFRVFPEGD